MLPSGHWTPPLISDNLGLFNSLLIEIALTIITAHVYVIIQVLLLRPPLSPLQCIVVQIYAANMVKSNQNESKMKSEKLVLLESKNQKTDIL